MTCTYANCGKKGAFEKKAFWLVVQGLSEKVHVAITIRELNYDLMACVPAYSLT